MVAGQRKPGRGLGRPGQLNNRNPALAFPAFSFQTSRVHLPRIALDAMKDWDCLGLIAPCPITAAASKGHVQDICAHSALSPSSLHSPHRVTSSRCFLPLLQSWCVLPPPFILSGLQALCSLARPHLSGLSSPSRPTRVREVQPDITACPSPDLPAFPVFFLIPRTAASHFFTG